MFAVERRGIHGNLFPGAMTSMYRILRNTHLALAMLSLPFLLLYALSSILMTHGSRFVAKPIVVETRMTVPLPVNDARTLARRLMDREGLRGELQQIVTTPGTLKFRIARPGTTYDVECTTATGDIVIRTSTAGFPRLLTLLHRYAGFWRHHWLFHLWSGFVVWTSAAILLLGINGVCLWFTRHQDRLIGAILLAANLGVSLTLLFLIRYS
jgi:hypothetical protein